MNTIITNEEIKRFVIESNTIEEIHQLAGHPLVDDHMEAVRFALEAVRRRELPDPRSIHKILLRSEPLKNPGEYRTCDGQTIGRNTTPSPDLIPSLMAGLLKLVLEGPKPGTNVEEWIWNTHCEFECIHPFVDGNGRVGRIWMNAIRVIHGLPWLTIFASDLDRRVYSHRINVFRWEHYRQYAAEDPVYDDCGHVETIFEAN